MMVSNLYRKVDFKMLKNKKKLKNLNHNFNRNNVWNNFFLSDTKNWIT